MGVKKQCKSNLRRVYVKLKFLNLTLSSITISLACSLTANAAPWDKKFYDRKDVEGTIILPMPCDGAMAFRVVKTNTKSPLEDQAIILGNESGEQSYAEHSTPNHISGSFTEKSDRYFLMGKYEVTTDQYNAVMKDGQCTEPTMKGLIPITNISWFDAVAFSNKYNEWLMKNHPDKLPKEDGQSGFVRLPTNTEWEYVVRGGAVVSESEFREKTFPAPEGIKSVAFGSSAANGRIQLVGQVAKPNPLGLFDMLGNASEMMFDSFRLNKLDRYHGQSGGITVRGGSYLTPEDQLSSSYRVELPFYSSQGEAAKAKDMGFRLVVVSPIITSAARIKALEAEWQKLGKNENDKDQEIVNNLAQITANTENKQMKEQLKKLEDTLRASNQAKDEQRNKSIQSALQLGAFLCTKNADLNKHYLNIKSYIEKFYSQPAADDEKYNSFKEKEKNAKEVRDFNLKYYADHLVETATIYQEEMVKAQVPAVINKLKNQDKSNLTDYVDAYWAHLQSFYKKGKVDREAWIKGCSDVAEATIGKK